MQLLVGLPSNWIFQRLWLNTKRPPCSALQELDGPFEDSTGQYGRESQRSSRLKKKSQRVRSGTWRWSPLEVDDFVLAAVVVAVGVVPCAGVVAATAVLGESVDHAGSGF